MRAGHETKPASRGREGPERAQRERGRHVRRPERRRRKGRVQLAAVASRVVVDAHPRIVACRLTARRSFARPHTPAGCGSVEDDEQAHDEQQGDAHGHPCAHHGRPRPQPPQHGDPDRDHDRFLGEDLAVEEDGHDVQPFQPALLDLPPRQAFDAALAAARDMGWEIVDANPGQGRIEATDTTFWFGFKDDVVIRVAPTKTGSRVDVRSLSRAGRSDVGTNAKRIRAFLSRLNRSR